MMNFEFKIAALRFTESSDPVRGLQILRTLLGQADWKRMLGADGFLPGSNTVIDDQFLFGRNTEFSEQDLTELLNVICALLWELTNGLNNAVTFENTEGSFQMRIERQTHSKQHLDDDHVDDYIFENTKTETISGPNSAPAFQLSFTSTHRTVHWMRGENTGVRVNGTLRLTLDDRTLFEALHHNMLFETKDILSILGRYAASKRGRPDLAIQIGDYLRHRPVQYTPAEIGDFWKSVYAHNALFTGWHTDMQAEAIEFIKTRLASKPRPLALLDFGIANGALYQALKPEILAGIRLHGLAHSAQLDPSKKPIGAEAFTVDVQPDMTELLRSKGGTFDMALCTYVFAYLDDAERREVLSALMHAVRPDGEIVLVLHHPASSISEQYNEYRPYWLVLFELFQALVENQHSVAQKCYGRLIDHLGSCTHIGPDVKQRVEKYMAIVGHALHDSNAPRDKVPEELQEMFAEVRNQLIIPSTFRPILNPLTDLPLPPGLELVRHQVLYDVKKQPVATGLVLKRKLT